MDGERPSNSATRQDLVSCPRWRLTAVRVSASALRPGNDDRQGSEPLFSRCRTVPVSEPQALPTALSKKAYFNFLEYLLASSLSALPGVKRGCRVAGLALKVVGSPVKGLVPLRAFVAAL